MTTVAAQSLCAARDAGDAMDSPCDDSREIGLLIPGRRLAAPRRARLRFATAGSSSSVYDSRAENSAGLWRAADPAKVTEITPGMLGPFPCFARRVMEPDIDFSYVAYDDRQRPGESNGAYRYRIRWVLRMLTRCSKNGCHNWQPGSMPARREKQSVKLARRG